MLTLKQSRRLFEKAGKALVGGVNSPVRSFKAVDMPAIFANRGRGAYLWDADRNKYVDYIMSWGVHIFGHAYRPIQDAAVDAIKNSSSFGLATEREIKLAVMIKRHLKSIDKVRLVSSGTEACMTAVRLARAFTARSKIIKFDGCYHGHFDSLLVKSGSGHLTFGIPSGRGILPAYSRDTISIPFNDEGVFMQAVKKNRGAVACCIVEPVMCNAGVILPSEGFLKKIAGTAKQEKIVLIFDEVITGFRLSLQGAQGLFGITPDLTCLGKIIGGGFPLGAVGGRRQIMDLLSPVGAVYQAGTLSGNPAAVAAGIKTLECLESQPRFYQDLEKKTRMITAMLKKAARAYGVNITVNTIASLFSVFFSAHGHEPWEVTSFAHAKKADTGLYARFFSRLCRQGVLFPPSAFEACFVSQAHSREAMDKTGKAFGKALQGVTS